MIDKIYDAGDDALANLFQMTIGINDFITDNDAAAIRITNVDIPSSGATKYENHYKTVSIEKVSGKPEITKEFSFTFRVDRNYEVYNGFKAWKNAVVDSKSGISGPDTPNDNNRADVVIVPIDPEDNAITGIKWTFEGAMVTSLDTVSFDYSSGDPITVSVTMSFLAMDDTSV